MYTLFKIILSATVIAVITEIARRYPVQGGKIAALPIVSLLSIFWLYVQGETMQSLNQFVMGVLWGLPATILMLLIIAVSLHFSLNIVISIGLGMLGWTILLFTQDTMIKLFI
ncbi:DUF3147 family protein [Alkalicoccobacillus murimartini]|uniref:DUF3147 family protein n=1 Tax=Alkalicoccobacillus murimartini TaxID=171685 RepID=A0ABT9YBZ2_9BACI|nr:DUF3147 family protein [Alkalicoccobacillus murimartini]MDQ0205371.1 hypothetical protein [Alkalicoccobacillus murimartini]